MQYDITRNNSKGTYLDMNWIKVDEIATQDLSGFYDAIKAGDYSAERLKSLMDSLDGKTSAFAFNKAKNNPICWTKKMESIDDLIDFVYDMEHYIFMRLKTNTYEFINDYFRKEIDDPNYSIHYGLLMLYRDIVTESKLMSLRNISSEKVINKSKIEGEVDEEKKALVGNLATRYYFNESKVNGISTEFVVNEFDISQEGCLLKEVDKLLNSNRDLRRNLLSNRTMISIKYLKIGNKEIKLPLEGENKKLFIKFIMDYIKVVGERNIIINIIDNEINEFINEFMWEYFVSTMRNIDYGSVSIEDKLLSTFKKGDLVLYSGLKAIDTVDIRETFKSLSSDGFGLAVIKDISRENQSFTLEMFSSLSKDGSKTAMREEEVKFIDIIPSEPYNKNKKSVIDNNDKTKLFLERSLYTKLDVILPANMVIDLLVPRTNIFLNAEEINEINPLIKNFNLKRW